MDRETILAKLKGASAVFDDANVVAAYLFGSWARGEARTDSDVDVAVFIRPEDVEKTREWPPLDIVLEGKLYDATGLPVEVRVLNGAPLAFVGRVFEEGILFYSSDEELRIELEVPLRSQYLDFKPRLEKLRRERLEAFVQKGLT